MELNGVFLLSDCACCAGLTGYRTDEGQEALVMAFGSGQGRDKDRSLVTRDLSLRSVDTL